MSTEHRTTIELLQDEIGESAGPDLVVAVEALSDEQIGDLAERVLAQPIVPRGSPASTEVWPLIGARASTFTAGGSNAGFVETAGAAGINLFAAIDPRSAGTGRFSNSLLRALLYSHGLVVEDPLALACDMYVGTRTEMRGVVRTAIHSAVESLVEVAPLFEAGIVQSFFGRESDAAAGDTARFIAAEIDRDDSSFDVSMIWEAFESDYVAQLHPRLQQVWREIQAGNRSPSLDAIRDAAQADVEMVSTFIEVVTQIRPRSVVDNAIDVVAEAVADAEALGGRFDLLCPTSLFAKLLFVGDSDPVHALRVRELARVEIPTIENLLVEDVIAIRQTSDAFALWRTRLSLGLERAHALRDQLGPSVDTFELVGEVLTDARSGLFREFERSSTLRARLAEPLQFVAGALGGAAGGVAGGLGGAAVGASAAVLPPVLARFVRGQDAVPTFLRRRYMLFEPTALHHD